MHGDGGVGRWVLVGLVTLAVCGGAVAGNVGSKYDVDLYGYVKLDASFDSQKTAAGDILLFVLPEGPDPDEEFAMTARQTRFGLKVQGPDSDGVKTTARIEAGFWGEESDPDHKTKLRLRLAYADIAGDKWSLRAGQDWDTFITVIPRSVNFTYFGWQGSPGYRRPQVRLTKEMALSDSFKVTTKLAVAQNLGELYRGTDGDLDGFRQNDGDDSGLPEFQGNIIIETKLHTDTPAKLSVSGCAGREVLDTTARQDVEFKSELLMGTIFLPLVEFGEERKTKVALQGAVWEGQNLDAYEAGLGLGINQTLGREIEAKGGWGQLVVDFGKTSLVLGYGVDDPKDKDLNSFAADGPNARSKNEFIMGSVTHALNDAVKIALEVSHLTTEYNGAADAETDRAQAAVFYYF